MGRPLPLYAKCRSVPSCGPWTFAGVAITCAPIATGITWTIVETLRRQKEGLGCR